MIEPPNIDHVLARIAIDVRWRDLDAFNHVNNATYLTYLEQARLEWLRRIPGTWYHDHAMPVLVSSELNYHRAISWPADVIVILACERLGRTSITLSHHIVAADDDACLYSDGRVVMTWTDPAQGTAVAVPDAVRTVVDA